MNINKKILAFLVALACLIFQFSCTSLNKSVKGSEKGVYTNEESPKKVGSEIEEKSEKDSPSLKFGKALKAVLMEGDYEKALELFDDLDDEFASRLDIKHLKLSILISAKKIKEAKIYACELEKEYPDNTDVLYAQFMLAQAENNSNRKILYLNKIISKNSKDSRALIALGRDYYDKKNYKSARKNFIKAYKADNNCMESLLGLGRINYMENNLKQAELLLNKVLQNEPNNAIALAELARVKSETDRLFEALQDIKRAIEIDSKNPSHWLDLGAYNMNIGRKEEARVAYSNVIKLSPKYYIAYIYRAGLNDELGHKEEALQDYIKVCSLYPSYYFAWEGAGVLFWEKQDWQNARYAFVNALSRSPASYQYAILTALCDYKMGKKFESKKFMKQYLRTIDRSKKANEYFMCRLFVDFAGDTDILNRISKEEDLTKKVRMYFYVAEFYSNIKQKPELALKCYQEALSISTAACFEYRLAESTISEKVSEKVEENTKTKNE